MTLAVRGPRVLVQPEDQSITHRPSGLITVESYAPEVIGTILAAGDVREVAVGDVVLFPPSAGQVVEWQSQRLLVVQEEELLAVWKASES